MTEIENQEVINELLRMRKQFLGVQGCSVRTENENSYKAKCLSVAISAIHKTAEDDKAREEGRTRGSELVRAESLIGSRLYVCWRGDTADQVEIRDISSVCITGGGKIALEDGPYDGFICYMDEIGKWDDDKYVGLTRAEAEATLEASEQDPN